MWQSELSYSAALTILLQRMNGCRKGTAAELYLKKIKR